MYVENLRLFQCVNMGNWDALDILIRSVILALMYVILKTMWPQETLARDDIWLKFEIISICQYITFSSQKIGTILILKNKRN